MRVEKRRAVVEKVIIAESARWSDAQRSNDPRDKEAWEGAVFTLMDTINGPTEVFLGHLRLANLYHELEAPSYSQHGGFVRVGATISATIPASGTHLYYRIGFGDSISDDWSDDLGPRQLGGAPHPAASVFASTGAAITIPDEITTPVWIKSRTYNDATGEWSALSQALFTTARAAITTDIVISEVHYHPLPAATETDFDQDDFEFVQVMNIGDETVNLGGAAFVKTDTVPNPGQFPHYTTVTEAGTDYFAISYRRDPCAVGITPIIEVTTDLKEWKNGEAEGVIILVGITSDADGIPRHTYRFTNALVGDPSSRHVRLRVPAP